MKNKHRTELGHAVTYEKRIVFCGKPTCSKPHGPYWYAYWTAGGRVRTVYVGKKWRSVESFKPEALRKVYPPC
jgi:hypothetical protein